ncbi:MAG: helix-turn-helix domain-containing protein [Pontibacterium sp.]|jgi:hypothetical protein|tara:strand:- start:3965 stop:4180 length:216 start_codon:yes stop_codon:yes gene_type:complete
MTLDEYRRANKLTYKQLAEQLGASHPTIARRYCLPIGHKDRMIPNMEYMERIMTITSGAVQPNDFYIRRIA